jgi:rod shape-determining protein MreD
MLGQTLIVRAALLVALAALLEVALSPIITFGWVSPRFVVLGVVIAATGLREFQALLLGFFGGVLVDALGGGLFGVGTLSSVLAAAVSVRVGITRRKGEVRLLVQAVAVATMVYDLLNLFALSLTSHSGPPIVSYLVGGVVPDILVNVFLAYLVGSRLLRLITTKEQ